MRWVIGTAMVILAVLVLALIFRNEIAFLAWRYY